MYGSTECFLDRDAGPGDDLTRLLRRWSVGDEEAVSRLLPLVYEDLRRTARTLARRERQGHTLSPTALAHEAWIQLIERPPIQGPGTTWQSREHFFGVAAHTMRRVLVDYARRRNRSKRRAGRQRVPLFEETGADRHDDEPFLLHLAVDRALARLERFAPEDARIVELRFFGGFTLEETAECVGLSRRTVVRTWARAKAWLRAELEQEEKAAAS